MQSETRAIIQTKSSFGRIDSRPAEAGRGRGRGEDDGAFVNSQMNVYRCTDTLGK